LAASRFRSDRPCGKIAREPGCRGAYDAGLWRRLFACAWS
jgi:hypothetical protein